MQLMNKKAYRDYRFQNVFNYSLLMIGVLCVGNGYRIALQNSTPIESILALFVAIFFCVYRHLFIIYFIKCFTH